MLQGNRCEVCTRVVEGTRAARPQTKYCAKCAKLRKKKQTRESRPASDRPEYDRTYMRANRRDQALSTPFISRFRSRFREKLSFEAIRTTIEHLNIIVVEVTGLIVILTYCLMHIIHLWAQNQ